MRQAVILAGGKGTRLLSRSGALPKALIKIAGTPLLGHQFRLLREQGFAKVLLLVNHLSEAISEYCSTSAPEGLEVSILRDGEARGTAGAVLQALPQLDEQFAVLYGDTMLNVDFGRFWKWHAGHPQAAASLFLHPNDHPQDSDLVEVDESDRIVRFHSYPHPPGAYLPNLVNAALYIVRRDALPPAPADSKPTDFVKDLFPEMLQHGLYLLAYQSPEYIKDAGTPNRLDKVSCDLASGKIARSSLAVPQQAVFVDRDGTINHERGHISRVENFQLFDFVGGAIARLNHAEWRTVLITNQPVLARGEATAQDLREIHAKLDTTLAESGAFFDRKYFCPHHPDRGFSGEVAAMKKVCTCRKPAPGLILQAQKDLNIDLTKSWFIGDSAADIGAAKAAGVTSVLVQTGPSTRDPERSELQADFVEENFATAVELILDYYPLLAESCRPTISSIEAGSEWVVASSSIRQQQIAVSVLRRQSKLMGVPAEFKQFEPGLVPPKRVIFVGCPPSEKRDEISLPGSLSNLRNKTEVRTLLFPARGQQLTLEPTI